MRERILRRWRLLQQRLQWRVRCLQRGRNGGNVYGGASRTCLWRLRVHGSGVDLPKQLHGLVPMRARIGVLCERSNGVRLQFVPGPRTSRSLCAFPTGQQSG
jgi:hypothetical protein